jgi:hypothetical protein
MTPWAMADAKTAPSGEALPQFSTLNLTNHSRPGFIHAVDVDGDAVTVTFAPADLLVFSANLLTLWAKTSLRAVVAYTGQQRYVSVVDPLSRPPRQQRLANGLTSRSV